jgi:hypothetical protein
LGAVLHLPLLFVVVMAVDASAGYLFGACSASVERYSAMCWGVLFLCRMLRVILWAVALSYTLRARIAKEQGLYRFLSRLGGQLKLSHNVLLFDAAYSL